MNLVYFLVKKYFFSIFKNKTLRLPAIISLVSVFISVFSLIIVMFVMKGFEVKVQNKILSTFPHILIEGNKNLDSNKLPNVEKIFKQYGTYGAIVFGKNLEIIELKAINNKIQLDDKKKKLPQIAISHLLQIKNNLQIGDRLSIYVPDFSDYRKIKEVRAEIGKIIKAQGNFPTIFFDFDSSFRLLGEPKIFTQIELKNPHQSEKTISKIYQINPELKDRVIDWKIMNANLFNIMKLERFSLAIFLSFLILISATTIYSNTLSMISLRKNDIATLMTLGASKNSIMKIFTITNFLVAFIGYLLGLLFSLIVMFLLLNSNLIESFSIDLSFYGIKGFPIVFSKFYLLIITGFVFIITFLASYLPAKFYLSKKAEYLIKDYMQ